MATQSQVREKLGGPLSSIFFEQVHPVGKELLGLISLKGDDETIDNLSIKESSDEYPKRNEITRASIHEKILGN